MKIGGYEVLSLETGRFALDGGAMFGVVPWVFWSKMISPDERGRINLARDVGLSGGRVGPSSLTMETVRSGTRN